MEYIFGKALFIASDHAGFALKNAVAAHARGLGFAVTDLGTHSADSCDYPLYAHELCAQVLASASPGILICGTGIGMSMTANRHPGIRAALCSHEFHARAARAHNNANVLCLGARVTAQGLACILTEIFLTTPFEGGRHIRRIEEIDRI